MGLLATLLISLALAALAIGVERALVRLTQAVWLAYEPLCGEHTDSVVYHRSLWTPGQRDLSGAAAALVASGLLLAAAWQWPSGLLATAALALWLAALAWDLWRWERVAASVKFVSWRRGWRHSARRVAVSDLKEVNVVERSHAWPGLPAWAQPSTCYVALSLRDGKLVKLPRTGALFGGARRVEALANFVRLQIDGVADNRRRAVADKRSAARRALVAPRPAPETPSAAPSRTVGVDRP